MIIGLKRLAKWLSLALLAAIVIFLLTPLGRYLARAAVAEAQILLARRPIEAAIRDPRTSWPERAKLELVIAARRFAVDSLGLKAGKSFTQFTQLDRDTLVLVLSATPRDWLVPHTWWFPVVGRLPYKGFFDFHKAQDEAQEMSLSGYDVSLRPASAFSTLGWFNDPILSTTLASDSVDLVDTVIHELTHNTFFAKEQTTFNESFANFVGAQGAAAFFRMRRDTLSAREADNRWFDQDVLGRYWAKLFRELDSTFRSYPADTDKPLRLRLRDSVYTAARKVMEDSLSKELRGVPLSYLQRVRMDNASLMGRRVYASDLDIFNAVFESEGRNIRSTIETIIAVATNAPVEPTAALREYARRKGK